MRINNNLMAINSYRQLGITNSAGAKAMEKLSSGLRINRAGDDAAGLAISEKMRGQIRGLTQASRNAQDGISLIQTAEGALNETHAILQRMRELAVQAATDTNTGVDRSEIQKEMNELIDEIDRIAEQTQFNELNLLDGTFTDKKFHIGANANQNIMLDINAMGSGTSLKTIDGNGEYTQGTDTVLGFENQTVLKDSNGDIAAVKLGDSWYALNNVSTRTTPLVLQAKGGASPMTTIEDVKVADGTTILKEGAGDEEVVNGAVNPEGTKIMLNASDDSVVAVSFDDGATWYTPGSFEVDGSNNLTLKAIEDRTEVTITDEKVIGTDILTTDTETVAGVENVDVLKNGGVTVAVKVGGEWYAPTDVKSDGGQTVLVANDPDQTLTVADTDGFSALGVATLRVDNPDESSTGGIMTQDDASTAITTIQTAIEKVSAERSKLGAYQNRLEHTIRNLDTSAENLQASESRIRDVDYTEAA
mgnify:CR=1 FL=1